MDPKTFWLVVTISILVFAAVLFLAFIGWFVIAGKEE